MRLPPGIIFDDVVQSGMIGLLKASQHFDASRGFQFSTFATRCIWREMLRCVQEHQTVIKKERLVSNFWEETEKLKSTAWIDAVGGQETRDCLLRSLDKLFPQERQVVAAYYGLFQQPKTMLEVAKDIGKTKARVQQILRAALNRLRLAKKSGQIVL